MDITYYDEYISINGIKEYLLYFPKPESDVVILHLHGGPGGADSLNCFFSLPDILPANMVFYDQRGAGKTQLATHSGLKDVTMENLLSDLKATISYLKAKLKTEKIILLGHSFGTVLGHEYVKQNPEDVAAFISVGQVVNLLKAEAQSFSDLKPKVLSAGLDKDKNLINQLEQLNYPYIEKNKDWDHYMRAFRHLESVYFPSFSDLPTLYSFIFKTPNFKLKDLRWLRKKGRKETMRLSENLVKYLLTFNIMDGFHYRLPYFAIVGSDDHITPTLLVKNYYDLVEAPLKDYFEIPQAGHTPGFDNLKEYNNVINIILFKLFNEPLRNK